MAKSIQFRRNTKQIYASRDAAKTALTVEINNTSRKYLDGEQVFGRYEESGTVKTLVAYVYSNGSTKSITFSDEFSTSGGGGSVKEVIVDEKTIKHNGATQQLFAADAIIENEFTVLGGNVGQITNGTKIESGTTVIELLKKMLVKEADCTAVLPTCSMTISPSTSPVEVGTVISLSATTSYTDGKFTGSTADYGTAYSVNAGCAQGAPILKRGTTVVTNPDSYTITEGTTTWSCTYPYSASTVTPKKNNGENSTKTISSGTTSPSTKSLTGQYKYYYGATTASTIADVTTNGLTTGWTTVNGTTTIVNSTTKYTLPENYFVIMCENGYKLNSIQDYSFNTDYIPNFSVVGTKTIKIGNNTDHTYNVYIWTKNIYSTPSVKNITLAKK